MSNLLPTAENSFPESPHAQILVRFGWQQAVGKFELPASNGSELSIEPDRWQDGQSHFEAGGPDGHSTPLRTTFKRNDRLIVQSPRGIEAGRFLGTCSPDPVPMGQVIRRMTAEDQLLDSHLQEFGRKAFQRCAQWLDENRHQAVLLEVEPLLDCKTLFFHFLSGTDPLIQQHVDQLVRLYEAEVAASEFVRQVAQGCGPGCGTEVAAGCGASAGCSQCQADCAVKKAVENRRS
jgi:hypothetical protein